MGMLPIFIIGLMVGIFISYIYFYYAQSVQSKTKFKLQEDMLKTIREDMQSMEQVNEDLRNQLENANKKKK